MHRRQLLKRACLATAGVTALAGCTDANLKQAEAQPPLVKDLFHKEEFDLPVSQKFEKVAAGVLTAADADVESVDDFEVFLDKRGIGVESVDEVLIEGEPYLSLEFKESADGGLLSPVGVVAGGYAALIEADHDSEALEATIHDRTGRTFGEFEVVRDWAERYNDRVVSAAKYGGLVLDTLESLR